MHRSISILTAAAIVAVASPAIAQQDVRTASVSISNADFATPQTRATLNHRIERAVEDLCGVNAMAEGESWGSIKKCHVEMRRQFDREVAAMKSSQNVQLSAR